MTVEHLTFFQERIRSFQEDNPGIEITVEGNPSLINGGEPFNTLISELLNNCEDKGAGSILITIEDGRLIVEDDIVYNNPGEILANLNSPNPKSTKSGSHGGVSIILIRERLEKIGGQLKYHTEEGRIIAEATWREI